MRPTTELEREVFQYLNDLRESGDTNMWGAAPYVEAHFAMTRNEARAMVTIWMSNFSESGDYDEVKDNSSNQ